MVASTRSLVSSEDFFVAGSLASRVPQGAGATGEDRPDVHAEEPAGHREVTAVNPGRVKTLHQPATVRSSRCQKISKVKCNVSDRQTDREREVKEGEREKEREGKTRKEREKEGERERRERER